MARGTGNPRGRCFLGCAPRPSPPPDTKEPPLVGRRDVSGGDGGLRLARVRCCRPACEFMVLAPISILAAVHFDRGGESKLRAAITLLNGFHVDDEKFSDHTVGVVAFRDV